MIHFATLQADSKWKNLCGKEGEHVQGTLRTKEEEITCAECRRRWRAGMQRVYKLFEEQEAGET